MGDGVADRALQGQRRGAQSVRIRHHHGLALVRCGQVAEHDRRVEGPPSVGGEVRRTGIAAAAPAGRDEHDRALGLARGKHARELQQRGRAGQLRACARARGVAVGEDRDRGRVGGAGALRDHRREGARAVDRLSAEAVRAHREASRRRAAETFQVARDVRGQLLIAVAARAPVGVFPRQGVHFAERARPEEGVGRQRGSRRRRSRRRRERGDHQR